MQKDYYKRDRARPWGMKWPKQQYKIMTKDEILPLRKAIFKKLAEEAKPSPNFLTEEQLALAYCYYIVPTPYGEKNEPAFYDPFESYLNWPKSEREEYGDITADGYYDDESEDYEDFPKKDYTNIKYPLYTELLNLNVRNNDEIIKFVDNNGLLGIFFHRYRCNYLEAPEAKVKADEIIADMKFREFKPEKKHHLTIDASPGLWFGQTKYLDHVFPATSKHINDTFFPLIFDHVFPATSKHINDTFFPLIDDPYEPRFLTPYEINYREESHIAALGEGVFAGYDFSQADPSLERFANTVDAPAKQPAAVTSTSNSWFFNYCEPLGLFIEEVCLFQRIVKKLTILKSAFKSGNELTYEEVSQAKILVKLLNQNLSQVFPKPFVNSNSRELEFGWEVPSLLSAYYLMLFLDHTNNRNVKLCEREDCRRAFIPLRSNAKYCETNCQEVQKKRNKRSREKEAKNPAEKS